MAANILDDTSKAFIVRMLAKWTPMSMVQEMVLAEFGLTLGDKTIRAYDPTSFTGRKLAAKWVKLFEDTRSGYIEADQATAINRRAYRQDMRQVLFNRALASKNTVLAQSILKDAAADALPIVGGRADGDGGRVRVTLDVDVPLDELRLLASKMIAEAPTR